MEIKFSMRLKDDGKTVQIAMLCTECQGELEMAARATMVRFRCPKHGEVGILTAEQFADGLRQVQERASQQFGVGKPVGMKVVPPEPTVQ